MAIDLKRITTGRQSLPIKALVYSFDGVGKTTFAAGSPDPFFIDANRGSHRLDVKRYVPESWSETKELVSAVAKGGIKCETLVLDAVTDLELMSHAELFPDSSVAAWEGGYGKGDQQAVAAWREFLLSLERIWRDGKNLVLVAHATVKKFDDPTGPGFERFEVSCRPRLSGLLRQWVDYVLFCREEVATQKIDGKARGVTTGARYMFTKRVPAWDAKARGSSLFPERILLSWADFADAVRQDEERIGTMRAEIAAMLAEVGDKGFAEKIQQFLRTNPLRVVETHNRLVARVEDIRKAPKLETPKSEEVAAS